jgi:hypothetical protein
VPVELPHILQRDVIVGEEPAVKDEELGSDEGGQGKGREGFGKELVDSVVVLETAFALETVHAVHVVGLVVAAVEEEGLGVFPLVGVEEEGNFGGPGAAVNKVTVEEVAVCGGGEAVETEDF